MAEPAAPARLVALTLGELSELSCEPVARWARGRLRAGDPSGLVVARMAAGQRLAVQMTDQDLHGPVGDHLRALLRCGHRELVRRRRLTPDRRPLAVRLREQAAARR